MISATRHLAAVLTWKPLAATAVTTAGWLAFTERPSPLLLSATAAAVAAATPFVLDDTAAATLQSSPATLRQRRAHRVAIVLPLLVSWWTLALIVVSRPNRDLPLATHTLQFATLLGIGLAAASTTSRTDSDRARGGTLGALAVIICFGTGFLPERALQLVPADPAAPDAGRQLFVILAVAVAIQLGGSTDPARRTTLRLRRLLVRERRGSDHRVPTRRAICSRPVRAECRE
jgi:hypothetical protein